MRLLLDCDGVLADWMGAVTNVIKQATGRLITPEETKGWLRLSELGLTKTEKRYIESELSSPGFVESLRVLPGALEGIASVVAATGCEVAIVTAQWDSETWLAERKRWLKKHKFLKTGVGFVATREKYLVSPGLLLDDKIQNVIDYNAKAVGGRSILWSTPYNLVDPTRASCGVIVNNWEQVTEEMSKYVKRFR